MEIKGRAKFLLLLTGLVLSPLAGASTGRSSQLTLVEDLPAEQRSNAYAQILNHLKNNPEDTIPQDSTIAVDQGGKAYVVTKDGNYVFAGMPSTVSQ